MLALARRWMWVTWTVCGFAGIALAEDGVVGEVVAVPDAGFRVTLTANESDVCDVTTPTGVMQPGCEGLDPPAILAQARAGLPSVSAVRVVWAGDAPITVIAGRVPGAPIRSSESIAAFVGGVAETIGSEGGGAMRLARFGNGKDHEALIARGVPTIRLRAIVDCAPADESCVATQTEIFAFSGKDANVACYFSGPASASSAIESLADDALATVELAVEPDARFDHPRADRIGYALGQLTGALCCIVVSASVVAALGVAAFLLIRAQRKKATPRGADSNGS